MKHAARRMPREYKAAAKTSKVGLINDETVAICKTACAAYGHDGTGANGLRAE